VCCLLFFSDCGCVWSACSVWCAGVVCERVRQWEQAMLLVWLLCFGQGVIGGSWKFLLLCSFTLFPRLVTMLARVSVYALLSSLCCVFVWYVCVCVCWLIGCLVFVLWSLFFGGGGGVGCLVLGASRTGEGV